MSGLGVGDMWDMRNHVSRVVAILDPERQLHGDVAYTGMSISPEFLSIFLQASQ